MHPQQIRDDFDRLGPIFAADLETALIPDSYKGRGYLRLIGCFSNKHSFWYDLKEFTDAHWDVLKDCLESTERECIWHNAEFDIRCLWGAGIHIRSGIHCTLTQSQLIHNGFMTVKHSLAAVAKRELGVDMDKEKQAQNWMDVELEKADIQYLMDDCAYCFSAYFKQREHIRRKGLDIVYEIEMKTLHPAIQMMSTGLLVDREELDEMHLEYKSDAESTLVSFIELLDHNLPDGQKLPRHEENEYNYEMKHLYGKLNLETKPSGYKRKGTKLQPGFNPASRDQILKYFALMDPPVEPVDRDGKPTTDQYCLAKHKHVPVVGLYLDWKKLAKAQQICKTLLKHVDDDSRIHARFNSRGTGTGRWSSSNPNLQNVPRGAMRNIFVAPEGRMLVDLDYSGMELRAACSPRIANEPLMMQAFKDGADIHKRTAALMFKIDESEVSDEQRRQAKATNFASLFGGSPGGLVNYFSGLGLEISLAEATVFLNAWLQAYPKIAEWHQKCKRAVENGEDAVMVDGRRRALLGDQAKYTVMCNNIVQGSCASAMKLALYGIWRDLDQLDPSARLVAVVHDQVTIEADENCAAEILEFAQSCMVEAGKEIFGDEVLLEAEGGIGRTWGEAH